MPATPTLATRAQNTHQNIDVLLASAILVGAAANPAPTRFTSSAPGTASPDPSPSARAAQRTPGAHRWRDRAAECGGFSWRSSPLGRQIAARPLGTFSALSGVDRDSEQLAHIFDEQDPGVEEMIRLVIERTHRKGRKLGLCGQAPSDHPEFARFLSDAGIDGISVTSEALPKVVEILRRGAPAESKGSARPGNGNGAVLAH